MADIDCDFGDCDCDCDFDCCCCCCDDFGWCCGDCFSSDGDNTICCCLICIGSSDSNKHNRDSNCFEWLCCCCDGSRKRRKPSSDPNWTNGPEQKRGFEGNREENERKKESGSKHATYPTCYSCGGPIDLPARYKHQYEHDDSNWDRPRCSRCSSFPPSTMEPPGRQEFHRFGRENYFPRYHMRN